MKVSKWSIWIESVLLYKIKARPSLLLFLMYSKPKKVVNVYKNGFIHAYGNPLNVLKHPIVLWSSWTTNRIICRKIWWSTESSMIPRTHRTLTSFGHCMIMPTCEYHMIQPQVVIKFLLLMYFLRAWCLASTNSPRDPRHEPKIEALWKFGIEYSGVTCRIPP